MACIIIDQRIPSRSIVDCNKGIAPALLALFVALVIIGCSRAVLIFSAFAFIRLWRVLGSVGGGLPAVPALLVRAPACSAFSLSFAQMITPYRIQSVVSQLKHRWAYDDPRTKLHHNITGRRQLEMLSQLCSEKKEETICYSSRLSYSCFRLPLITGLIPRNAKKPSAPLEGSEGS